MTALGIRHRADTLTREDANALERLRWYMLLRWAGVAVLYTSGVVGRLVAGFDYSLAASNVLAPIVLLYNVLVWRQLRIWRDSPPPNWRGAYRALGNLQCSADLLVLTIGLHFGGGIESWGGGLSIVAVLVVAGLVLPSRDSLAQGVLACALFDGVIVLEATGRLSHVSLGVLAPETVRSARFVASVLFGHNAVTLFILTLVVFLAARLRAREAQLAEQYEVERAAAERLRQLDEMKSGFLATVSHELRTPLSAIVGFSSHLARHGEKLTEATRSEQLGVISRQAARLRRLVEELLDFSALEAGTLQVQLKSVDLAAAAHTAVDAAAVEASVEISDGLLVMADPGKLDQILVNLLDNAKKYGRPPVVVRAAERDDEIVVSVVDAGEGIPSGREDEAFDRFTQLENHLVRTGSGVGLGLALVRGYVEAHGGRIWHERPEEGGAAFCFNLQPGSHRPSPPRPEHQPTRSG